MAQARAKRSASFIRPLMAGVLAALLGLCAPSARAMTFETLSGSAECVVRQCVLASGPVDKASVGAFLQLVRERRIAPGAVVLLNSEGGYLLYGIRLGEEIRRAGFATAVNRYDAAAQVLVPADCASACAFAFLGGVERDVAPGSRVGVHQIYANVEARDGLSVGDVQFLTSLTAMHIDNMGGGVGILIEALRTPPDVVHWFSDPELSRLAVTTAHAAMTLASN